MTKSEKAINYFTNNYNCSQSVLTAFAPELGLSENDCLKVSCAFGGGMARHQKTCGAVTGALMAIGLKYGKALNEDEAKKINTYAKSSEFLKAFEEANLSTVCLDLLDGLDMRNEADAKRLKELDLFRVKCDKYVANAVKILEEMFSKD